MQILGKYKKWKPAFVVDKKNIWDFNICYNSDIIKKNEKIIGNYIVNNNGWEVQNNIIWDNFICETPVYKNIGFTGIDNGLVDYDSNTITNEGFVKLLKSSTLNFNGGNLSFKNVKSNTKTYDFSSTIVTDEDETYLKLCGGFYQTPFKINNNYQVLPTEIDDNITFNIILRPRDYTYTENTLNTINPNNEGIFLYIGTRAENKFLFDYDYNFDKFKIRKNYKEFCSDRNYYAPNEIFTDSEYFLILNDENYISKCEQPDYFEHDFLEVETNLEKTELKLSNDLPIDVEGYHEIKTNNKYLFFNNTKDGFNVNNWDENNQVILTATTRENINMFLLLNNGKTGYTVENIDEYLNSKKNKDILKEISKDITENALAFRIKKDGSIGYRYIINDTSCEKPYKIIEEYSLPNIISNNVWNDVDVKIKKINSKKMVLYIYINKLLKFISKELPILNLRKLNDIDEKQEGVPFNISIGGGTMGLCDSISWDYNHPFKYVLPLEENFAGTFIGDIKHFKIIENKE